MKPISRLVFTMAAAVALCVPAMPLSAQEKPSPVSLKGDVKAVKILTGIGHDSQKTEFQQANDLADQHAQARIIQQGIPADGKSTHTVRSFFGVHRVVETADGATVGVSGVSDAVMLSA